MDCPTSHSQGPRHILPKPPAKSQSTPPPQYELVPSMPCQQQAQAQTPPRRPSPPQIHTTSPQQQSSLQIQAPRPQFPPKRPFRHQTSADFQAQAKVQAQSQAQSHARALQQRLHNFHQSLVDVSNQSANQPQPVVRQQLQPQTQQLKAFLDTAFRVSAERFQAELTSLRAVCAKAVCKEQRDKEMLRTYCLAFRRERDIARERVRKLMGRRGAEGVGAEVMGSGQDVDWSESRGVKRGREDSELSLCAGPYNPPSPQRSTSPPSTPPLLLKESRSEEDLKSLAQSYPSSSTSPRPSLPISYSPLPRRRSPLARSASAGHERDTTAFDVTIVDTTGETLLNERAYKRRRASGSSESSSESSSRTLVGDGEKEWFGEADMELESEADLGEIKGAVMKDCDGDKPASSPRQIDVSHVDLMYVPMNGKLVCRVCMLRNENADSQPATTPLPPPKCFPTNASWDALREHCAEEHPVACADLAGLGPGQIIELRRRMGAAGMV